MPSVMSNKKFLTLVQKFTAVQAVDPSTVRGQPKHTLEKIQAYLGRFRLDRLAGMDPTGYPTGAGGERLADLVHPPRRAGNPWDLRVVSIQSLEPRKTPLR